MPHRIDALEGAPRARYSALGGAVLSERDDPELDAIVREAAALLEAPIALVSLVLERTQLFRAQVGLPPGLAAARATDREISMCQFVVRDRAPFEVADADTDARIPRALVEGHGVRAYLGMPLRVADEVIGSLCAMDVVPRAFTDPQRSGLAALAERASRRLAELARERHAGPPLAALAARPALEELRNRLTPILLGLDRARVSVAELGALRRLASLTAAPAEARALEGAARALDDLRATIDALEDEARALTLGVGGLELLLVPGEEPTLVEVVEAAARLAHHHTKLIGGVEWSAIPAARTLRAPRAHAVSVLAAAMSSLARGAPRPLRISARLEGGRAILALDAGLDPAELAHRTAELAGALGSDARLALRAAGGALELSIAT